MPAAGGRPIKGDVQCPLIYQWPKAHQESASHTPFNAHCHLAKEDHVQFQLVVPPFESRQGVQSWSTTLILLQPLKEKNPPAGRWELGFRDSIEKQTNQDLSDQVEPEEGGILPNDLDISVSISSLVQQVLACSRVFFGSRRPSYYVEKEDFITTRPEGGLPLPAVGRRDSTQCPDQMRGSLCQRHGHASDCMGDTDSLPEGFVSRKNTGVVTFSWSPGYLKLMKIVEGLCQL